ncbi:MAG: acyl-CoA dehydrogenase family protein [Steroidobacteraceae bacterium]
MSRTSPSSRGRTGAATSAASRPTCWAPPRACPTTTPVAQKLRQVWLFSRSDTIYAGANEIQLNLIAERALGMPR